MLGAVVMQDCGVIEQVSKFGQAHQYLMSVTDEVCKYILIIDSNKKMKQGTSSTAAKFWKLLIELRLALRFV